MIGVLSSPTIQVNPFFDLSARLGGLADKA